MNRRLAKTWLLIVTALVLSCAALSASADVTVRFDPNGGTAAFEDMALQPDGDGAVRFSIPPEEPVRSGYNFIGWYQSGLEMESPLRKPGEPVVLASPSGTVTYAAQWEDEIHPCCPYLMAWAKDYTDEMNIIRIDFRCVEEAPHTYYAVHCWNDVYPGSGYAGFQVLDDGTHVLILSLWDVGGQNPAIEYSPLSRKSGDFGGEGTGKQVISLYPWTAGTWYTMQIQARTSENKTVYEQWIRPEDGEWEKIAAISFPQPDIGFSSLVAFLEDFFPFSNQRRSMQLRNASGRLISGGEWRQNKAWNISNYENQALIAPNVPYDCKAEAAGPDTLYMEIGGSGFEKVISLPKPLTLEKCETTDPRMLGE